MWKPTEGYYALYQVVKNGLPTYELDVHPPIYEDPSRPPRIPMPKIGYLSIKFAGNEIKVMVTSQNPENGVVGDKREMTFRSLNSYSTNFEEKIGHEKHEKQVFGETFISLALDKLQEILVAAEEIRVFTFKQIDEDYQLSLPQFEEGLKRELINLRKPLKIENLEFGKYDSLPLQILPFVDGPYLKAISVESFERLGPHGLFATEYFKNAPLINIEMIALSPGTTIDFLFPIPKAVIAKQTVFTGPEIAGLIRTFVKMQHKCYLKLSRNWGADNYGEPLFNKVFRRCKPIKVNGKRDGFGLLTSLIIFQYWNEVIRQELHVSFDFENDSIEFNLNFRDFEKHKFVDRSDL